MVHMAVRGDSLFYITAFFIGVASPVSVPDEQRLFEDLMMGYEKSVRPVINANTILKVTFSLKLNQIIDLDERHQVLTTNVFIDQTETGSVYYW